MKNYKIISLLSLAFVVCSCEGLYESKYNNEWTYDEVWGNSTTISTMLNNLYTGLSRRPDSYGCNFLDVATDNAMTSYRASIMSDLGTGNYSARYNPLDNWSTNYSYIQDANDFLENFTNDDVVFVTTSDTQDEATKHRLRGEAYFLKAFYFFEMLRVFGGRTDSGDALGYVITDTFVSTDEANAMLSDYKRNTYKECVDHLNGYLDIAIDYLGRDGVSGVSSIGRATDNTARALKSRIALYGASPAYQDSDVVQILGMGDFAVVDETTYLQTWEQTASLTYQLLMDAGFTAINKLSSTDLADVTSSTPNEFLFRFYFSSRSMETYHFMPRYFGTAYTVPSQNLVDAYPTIDGYPITDPRSSYNANDPYADRDNRFALSIYYHGADYGSELYATDSQPLTQVDILPDGLDAPTKNLYASHTGYYLAKFLSKRFDMNNPTGTSSSAHYFPELRYTEMALNYAEAANEAWGPYGYGYYDASTGEELKVAHSAYDIIKELRSTSGGITDTSYLDEAAQNKDTFRELIQNERRIELAFENHRFFDLRRCLLPLNESIRGVEASYSDSGDVVFDFDIDVEERKFDGVQHYYLPLPADEVTKGLENNMGW